MSKLNRWILTDGDTNTWHENFELTPTADNGLPAGGWYIRKRTLRGGVRAGVELVELANGALTVRVLPTRGCGIWNADFRGLRLGWDAPVRGPVNPHFVNQLERNGIGWLTGFDEWLCRCGLVSNGPPGADGSQPLTLHGRIANTPAHFVEVGIDPDPPHALFCTGQVDEGGLFLGRLRLTSTVRTVPGSNRLTIHDVVQNLAASPAEMQLLYHLNFGPPILEAGATVAVPFVEMAPQTPRAAEGVSHFDRYLGPTSGYAEQVYLFRPAALENGQTLALLSDAAGERGAAVFWNVRELPCFTVWKNTIPLDDGYVTGLEPATNFPYFKAHERQHGRVPVLLPGAKWEATWSIEALETAAAVRAKREVIDDIQARTPPIIHRSAVWA